MKKSVEIKGEDEAIIICGTSHCMMCGESLIGAVVTFETYPWNKNEGEHRVLLHIPYTVDCKCGRHYVSTEIQID